MLDELRRADVRQRANHQLRTLVFGCKRLLSERGETNSMAIARQMVERIDALSDEQCGDFFDYLSLQLSPDPKSVLQAAQTYAEQPNARHLIALAEPPRQELLRRLNRTPAGRQPQLAGPGQTFEKRLGGRRQASQTSSCDPDRWRLRCGHVSQAEPAAKCPRPQLLSTSSAARRPLARSRGRQRTGRSSSARACRCRLSRR